MTSASPARGRPGRASPPPDRAKVVMIGVGEGISLPFLFFHAPRGGAQISSSQPHKT